MAILKKAISFFLIFLAISSCLGAWESLIILDKSWSMKGFFNTGAMGEIYTGLTGELNRSKSFSDVKLFAFSTAGLQEYAGFKEIKCGGDTLIDRALEEAILIKPGVILLITDNIQDPGGINPDTDVTRFYSLMKKETVEWVFFFPLKLRFRGWVYGNSDWSGQRAAIMYALLLKNEKLSKPDQGKREKEFLSLVSGIEHVLGTHRIRCKPLERGVMMSVRKSKGEKKQVDITSTGVKVQFQRFTPFPRFNLKLKIRSKYSNIVVRQAKIEGWTLGQIKKKGHLKDLQPHRLQVKVRPDLLHTLGPSAVDERYLVEMRYDGLKLDNNVFTIMKMPFSEESDISGEVQLIIRVPNKDFQLIPAILNQYGTGNKEDTDRIYGLEHLVPMLSAGKEVHIKRNVKFNIIMPYPGWATLVLLGFLLLIILPVILGYTAYKNAAYLFLLKVNEKEMGRIRIFPFLWTPLKANDGGKMCRVKKKGLFILANPLPGFSWDGEDDSACRRFDLSETLSMSLLDEEGEPTRIELTANRLQYQEGGYKEDNDGYFEKESGSFFQD